MVNESGITGFEIEYGKDTFMYQPIQSPPVPRAWFFCGRYGTRHPLEILRDGYLFCNLAPFAPVMPKISNLHFRIAKSRYTIGDHITYGARIYRVLGVGVKELRQGWVWAYKVRSGGLA